MVVEAEEQLLCSSRGFMIKSWRMEVEDERGRRAGVFVFFSFHGRVESLPQILPRTVAKLGGDLGGFGGVFFLQFEVGLGLVGLGVILWSFLVILPPILP
jgi:hypothetical protein